MERWHPRLPYHSHLTPLRYIQQSRMYIGKERTTEDGSTWLVCEDWETSRGIVNDLFGVYTNEVISSLHERFTDDSLFLEVVQAITNRNDH